MYRVLQILCFTPLLGVRPRLLFLAYRYGCCFGQRPFHIAWCPPLRRAEDCPSLPLRVAALPLRLSCSEVQGPPVLLSYYVARVISCGSGALSNLSPLLGCLSGSSELAWGFVEPLRTYELRCPASGCALHPSLCLGWAPWVIPCHVFSWLSFLERGCGVLCFVTGFAAKTQAPPLLLSLRASLYRPNQRKTIAMGDCYILFRFGCASSAMRAVPFCRKV